MGKKRGYKQGRYRPINKEKYVGSYPCIYRSSWELKLMGYLDKNTNCKSWASESAVVTYFYPVDNKNHRYFIDFTATFIDKDGKTTKYYIEVKPSKELKKPIQTPRKKKTTYLNEAKTYIKNKFKWEAAEKWAEKRGAKFIIITEKELFKK
jgi:hypothetical protein